MYLWKWISRKKLQWVFTNQTLPGALRYLFSKKKKKKFQLLVIVVKAYVWLHLASSQVYMPLKLKETYINWTLEEVKPWSQGWLRAAGVYSGFCSMKRIEVFLLPLDGMLVHRRSLPLNFVRFPSNSPEPIYTPRWREAMREFSVLPNWTQHNVPSRGTNPGRSLRSRAQ